MQNDETNGRKLAALGHPMRLGIIRTLAKAGPAGLAASTLGSRLDIAANALTFHLQKLAAVNLVNSRREGRFVYYSAHFEELNTLVEHLVGACCNETEEKCGPQCAGEQEVPLVKTEPGRAKLSKKRV